MNEDVIMFLDLPQMFGWLWIVISKQKQCLRWFYILGPF